ncbi:hypothetical protein GCM10027284_28770 [Cyclobacterium sediminis]
MKYLALIFIIFIHCSPKKENELPISIEGEWIEIYEDTEGIYDWSGLKFENDTAYRISDFGLVVKGAYSIVENRIITDELDGVLECTILNLTEDSLKIERNGEVNQYYSRRLEYDKDLKINSISISTYKCMDLCWEFDYRLESDGIEVFNGKYNTQTLGIRKGKMEDKLLREIESLFKWSNIKRLNPERVPIAMDGWLIEFDINFNDNESISFSTTDFEIPYRIKPIFHLIQNHLKKKGLK